MSVDVYILTSVDEVNCRPAHDLLRSSDRAAHRPGDEDAVRSRTEAAPDLTLGVREVVVGFNHTFGAGARGTAALLLELGRLRGFVILNMADDLVRRASGKPLNSHSPPLVWASAAGRWAARIEISTPPTARRPAARATQGQIRFRGNRDSRPL